jgi:L-fuconolactonase
MIIDTHIHLYDPTRPQGVPWPDPNNKLLYRPVLPEHIKAEAMPEGVTGAVVFEASLWPEDNQWVLDLADNEPFLVGLIGRIEPNTDYFIDHLDRFAAHPKFRGVRFWGSNFEDIDQGSFMHDMEALAERNLLLDLVFPKADADGLFALMERLPDLRIMIEHIAQVPVDGNSPDTQWTEYMLRAAAHPQVSMKVSALMENSTVQPAPADVAFYTPTLDVLWNAFGIDRLVYGSNWPVCERAGSYARCIDIVRTYFSDKGEAATEQYFWRNAKSIYRWQE